MATAIGRLEEGRKGMGVQNTRKIYIACRRTTFDYGSRVWWGGQ